MKLISLETIDSTNGYAELIVDTVSENVLITTDRQTAGRGQYDRSWFSEPDKSITFSILLKKFDSNTPTQLRTLVSTLLKKIVDDKFNICTDIVPPNDLFLNGKKLAGVLIEAKHTGAELDYVIVGLGLNLNNDVFPNELQEKATSIFLETGEVHTDANFASDFADALEKELYA